MSLQLLDLQNIDEIMIINNWVSFEQTMTEVTLFWLLYFTAFIIEEFEDETIGQLHNDTNLFWLDFLSSVVLDLIIWVVVSLVIIHRKSIDKKAIQTIFHMVFRFNHMVNELSPNLNNIIYIKKNLSNPLILVYIKSHNQD